MQKNKIVVLAFGYHKVWADTRVIPTVIIFVFISVLLLAQLIDFVFFSVK